MHESQTLSENIGPVECPCWRFLKIGERDEDAFALTTWFRGPIFFGKLSWDCEVVADRQTDRLSKLKTGQILELSRSWGVGVFYKFPRFFVGALLCAVCCVLFCVLLQVVLLVVLVGKSRSAGGAPHYFLPSPPST